MLYGDFFMKRYIQDNINIILKFSLVCITGIVLGIVMYKFADKSYVDIIKNIFEQSKSEDFNGITVLVKGMKNNSIYILLCYMSLFCIYTPFVLLFLLLLKCASIGIYICSIFNLFGFSKGALCALVGVVLPNLFSLFGYILICTNIIDIYENMKNGIRIKLSHGLNYIYIFVISMSLISFSIVIEQLSSNIMLSLYNKI